MGGGRGEEEKPFVGGDMALAPRGVMVGGEPQRGEGWGRGIRAGGPGTAASGPQAG